MVKHKFLNVLAALLFLALSFSGFLAPARVAAAGKTQTGVCEDTAYVGSQKDSSSTAACSSDDYKNIENNFPSGVNKNNETNFCYSITEHIGQNDSVNVQKISCSGLTLTTCNSLGETGTYPNCKTSGGGGGGGPSTNTTATVPACDPTNTTSVKCACSGTNADTICGDPANNKGCTTSDSSQCDFIGKYINPAINLFSITFGLFAVISIIIGGINYSTSEGDPQKASRAKGRITNTIIAIIAYLFLYSFLQFIVPGGLFNRTF